MVKKVTKKPVAKKVVKKVVPAKKPVAKKVAKPVRAVKPAKKVVAKAKPVAKKVTASRSTRSLAKTEAAPTKTKVIAKKVATKATAVKVAPKKALAPAAPKKGGPFAGYTASELILYKQNFSDLEDHSVAQLKELLKKNRMTQSGNKDELKVRVADCKTMGTLPNCTKCGGGRLRFTQSNGTYFCKGYMDDADFINCTAVFDKNQVVRGDWTN